MVDQLALLKTICAPPRNIGAATTPGSPPPVCRSIVFGQRQATAAAHTHAARGQIARHHDDQVQAETARSGPPPRSCAPAPTAIMAITAPTPMMMPSASQYAASRFRSARSATRRVVTKFMPQPRRQTPQSRQCITRRLWQIAHQPAIHETTAIAKVATSLSCVDQHHGSCPALSDWNSAMISRLVAGTRRPGRLVSEDQSWPVDDSACDCHSLLLTAGTCVDLIGATGQPHLCQRGRVHARAVSFGGTPAYQRQLDVLGSTGARATG